MASFDTKKAKQSLSKLSHNEHIDKVTSMTIGFIVAGIVLAFLIGYFGIYQLFIRTQDIRAEEVAYNSHSEKLQTVLDNTGELASEIDSLGEDHETILQLLPASVQEEYLLQFLADAAGSSQVFLASYEPQPSSSSSSNSDGSAAVSAAVEYPFQVSLTGSYTDLRGFINQLENGSRYMNVREIQLAVDENSLIFGSGDPTLSVTIKAVAYSQQSSLNEVAEMESEPTDDNMQEADNVQGENDE